MSDESRESPDSRGEPEPDFQLSPAQELFIKSIGVGIGILCIGLVLNAIFSGATH
jgi:hypothetical protein